MTVLWLALFAVDAEAVAPTATQGSEPVRVFRTSKSGQAAFRRSPEWCAFTAAHGDWRVRADELAGTPHRMWGEGIEVPTDRAGLEAALRDLIDENRALFGVREALPLRHFAYDPDTDSWFVDFAAQRQGVDIWRSDLRFRVKHGKLSLIGVDTYPDTPTRGSFALDEENALYKAVEAGPVRGVLHTDTSVAPVWLPRVEANVLVLRAAYEVRGSTDVPRGDWSYFVDGETGALLAHFNRVHFLTGSVHAEVDVRYPGGPTQVLPVVGGAVVNGNDGVTTDANGNFDIPNGSQYQTHFLSSPLRVENLLGNVGLDFTAGDPDPIWDANNGSMPEMDVFVHTQLVRDAFQPISPSVGWTSGQTFAFVNLNDSCNAYYDGTINFYQAGSGCNNTGRLADVIYHEWGHGYHAESLLSGGFDGALSEGAGDIVSFLMTEDPNLAPGFFQSGGYLRTADNDRFYPDDIVGEVHEDGLIFAGAMWDTLLNIEAARGTAAAYDDTKRILGGLLKAGPGLEDSLEEALFADDDDGSLANGTPNECYIIQGFADHGLGELGNDVGFFAGHEPIAEADPSAALPIAVDIVGPASCVDDLAASTSTVVWRADGGAWQETALTSAGTSVTGAIPAQPFGTFIEYYVTIDAGGRALSAPTTAWRNPFGFYVGGVLPVRCDDFENGEAGYTHELVSGEFNEGADDWQHGAPGGRGGDPLTAHSGNNVWGNDLGFGDFNGQYQDDKHNRLIGPEVQLGHYEEALLTFWRWLNVEDGVYDRAFITANDQTVWTNYATPGQHGEDHHTDDQWAPHAVDLGNPRGSVQVTFELDSDGGLAMGGWTIDDVCIMAPATVNNRLGVTDFEAGEGEDSGIRLNWTNPPHRPLEEVRVVRGEGDCPSSVDDGEVVYFDDAPELGGAVEVFDPVPTTNEYCYVVFPGDGADFLGFTVEGWNLDYGSALTAATAEEIEEAKEENGVSEFEEIQDDLEGHRKLGCGCQSGGGALAGAWLLGLIPLLRRRGGRA